MENNKIIAEFMGMKQGVIIDGIGYYDTDELEYHISWDWLMPVFEKIQELEPNVPGFYLVRTARMGKGTVFVEVHTTNEGWDTKSHTFRSSSELTINAVYDVCIQVIAYYNSLASGTLSNSLLTKSSSFIKPDGTK